VQELELELEQARVWAQVHWVPHLPLAMVQGEACWLPLQRQGLHCCRRRRLPAPLGTISSDWRVLACVVPHQARAQTAWA
jgi:hypothetical protein